MDLIKNFKKLNLLSNGNIEFENLKNIISTTENIILTSKLLTYISEKNITKSISKKFLSAFIFKYFSDSVLNENNELSKNLITVSNKLLNSFENICNGTGEQNELLFIDSLDEYLVVYNEWEKFDRNVLITDMAMQKIELDADEKYININDKNKFDEDTKNKLLNHIIKCRTGININASKMNILDEVNSKYEKLLNTKVDITIDNQILDIGKKAYFDLMLAGIRKNQFDVLEKFLQELRNRLYRICPNKGSFKVDMDEYFDVEFIMQLIRNNVFHSDNFMGMFNYIMNTIRRLQASVDDKEFDEWKKKYLDDVVKEDNDYNASIVKFLRFAIERVERIEKQIVEVYDNIDINKHK